MTTYAHNGKRLREEGVGEKAQATAAQKPGLQKETPLAGRRAGDAISGGVSARHCISFAPHGKEKVGGLEVFG